MIATKLSNLNFFIPQHRHSSVLEPRRVRGILRSSVGVILTPSFELEKEGFGRGVLKGFVERSIPWLTRAFANTDLGLQFKTHGIHQPIAIGRLVTQTGNAADTHTVIDIVEPGATPALILFTAIPTPAPIPSPSAGPDPSPSP